MSLALKVYGVEGIDTLQSHKTETCVSVTDLDRGSPAIRFPNSPSM